MEKKFEGKVALVTGSATGMGRKMAEMFAMKGAKVVVSTRNNIEKGQQAVNGIIESGGEAVFVRCDISKEDDVKNLIDRCVATYGALDFAVNNAGVGPDGVRIPFAKLEEFPEEVWDKICDINIKGTMFCMKHEMKQMCAQRKGTIVNIASIGALNPVVGLGAYNVSKAGVMMLSKVGALEGAPFGVRVNTVLPGPTQGTDLMDNMLQTNENAAAMFERTVPLHKSIGRIASTEEIANAAIWLCSDDSSYITGQALAVEGGILLGATE